MSPPAGARCPLEGCGSAADDPAGCPLTQLSQSGAPEASRCAPCPRGYSGPPLDHSRPAARGACRTSRPAVSSPSRPWVKGSRTGVPPAPLAARTSRPLTRALAGSLRTCLPPGGAEAHAWIDERSRRDPGCPSRPLIGPEAGADPAVAEPPMTTRYGCGRIPRPCQRSSPLALETDHERTINRYAAGVGRCRHPVRRSVALCPGHRGCRRPESPRLRRI